MVYNKIRVCEVWTSEFGIGKIKKKPVITTFLEKLYDKCMGYKGPIMIIFATKCPTNKLHPFHLNHEKSYELQSTTTKRLRLRKLTNEPKIINFESVVST